MVTLLQPLALAEHCLLSELLYWVELRPFPYAISDLKDGEHRFSSEFGIFTGSSVNMPVSFAECELAGLRSHPRYTAFIEGKVESDFAYLDRMKQCIKDMSIEDQHYLASQRDELIAEAKEIEKWDDDFRHFLDYYKSKIFIDLRDGKLVPEAIIVTGSNEPELRKNINKSDFTQKILNSTTSIDLYGTTPPLIGIIAFYLVMEFLFVGYDSRYRLCSQSIQSLN